MMQQNREKKMPVGSKEHDVASAIEAAILHGAALVLADWSDGLMDELEDDSVKADLDAAHHVGMGAERRHG
jgi:hypothetical protein